MNGLNCIFFFFNLTQLVQSVTEVVTFKLRNSIIELEIGRIKEDLECIKLMTFLIQNQIGKDYFNTSK